MKIKHLLSPILVAIPSILASSLFAQRPDPCNPYAAPQPVAPYDRQMVAVGFAGPASDWLEVHGECEADDPTMKLSWFGNAPAGRFIQMGFTTNVNGAKKSSFSLNKGDAIIRSGPESKDFIFTNMNAGSSLRFGTTSSDFASCKGTDREALTIGPNGDVGIMNSKPKDFLQIGALLTIHATPDVQFEMLPALEGSCHPFLRRGEQIGYNCYRSLINENDQVASYEDRMIIPGPSSKIEFEDNGAITMKSFGFIPVPNDPDPFSLENKQYSKFSLSSTGAYFQDRVFIGTTDPGQPNTNSLAYMLAVNGNVKAKEITVSLLGWSDDVFRKDYKLASLDQVQEFINEKGHLPGIPSEAEVLEQGVQVGEMQSKLLRKVEELTLYLLEIKKEQSELKSENTKLQKELEAVKLSNSSK